MARREIKSKAPTPSMDNTVVAALLSVKAFSPRVQCFHTRLWWTMHFEMALWHSQTSP